VRTAVRACKIIVILSEAVMSEANYGGVEGPLPTPNSQPRWPKPISSPDENQRPEVNEIASRGKYKCQTSSRSQDAIIPASRKKGVRSKSMPRIWKTVIPRIKKSIRDYGVLTSVRRAFLLPIHLVKEYRVSRQLHADGHRSEFDASHHVDTDGDFGGWTYLSDLDIPSPNWIDANNYHAIDPERFNNALASIGIAFDGYTFVDYGSGKGRALLLASEYQFKEILGLEFSPELHRIAENNVRRYSSVTQKCKDIRCLNLDFVDFDLPPGPLVLFFFDPCRLRVIEQVVARIDQAAQGRSSPVYVVYVAPRTETEGVFNASISLKEIFRSPETHFVIYKSC
jgi:hypothetical protein